MLEEIRTLADQGVREHVLVAQDTSRFGMDTHGRSLLPELMVRAADIPAWSGCACSYCYPDEVDDYAAGGHGLAAQYLPLSGTCPFSTPTRSCFGA